MNLKQLKKMIAEEYRYYMKEQGTPPVGPGPGPAGAPPMPPAAAPTVDVDDMDIDATGGDENPEETLKDIYDMLKDYFEGGAGADDTGADDAGADDDADDTDDADDADDAEDADDADEDEDDAEALQERFKKLANIIKG